MMIGAAVGMTIGLGGNLYSYEPLVNKSYVVIMAAVVGSLMPDIDHPKSTFNQKFLLIKNNKFKKIFYSSVGLINLGIGYMLESEILLMLGITLIMTGFSKHRGVTHSILGTFLYTYTVKLIANKYGMLGVYIGFSAGYISHLVADYFTKRGIQMFYPFGKNIKSPLIVKSGGIWEDMIFGSASVYCAYVLWQQGIII